LKSWHFKYSHSLETVHPPEAPLKSMYPYGWLKNEDLECLVCAKDYLKSDRENKCIPIAETNQSKNFVQSCENYFLLSENSNLNPTQEARCYLCRDGFILNETENYCYRTEKLMHCRKYFQYISNDSSEDTLSCLECKEDYYSTSEKNTECARKKLFHPKSNWDRNL
jgi:hypothetical protein